MYIYVYICNIYIKSITIYLSIYLSIYIVIIFNIVLIGILVAPRHVETNLEECGMEILMSVPVEINGLLVCLVKVSVEIVLKYLVVVINSPVKVCSQF